MKMLLVALLLGFGLFAGGDAFAQAVEPAINLNLGTGEGLTARVLQLAALMTVLSLAPSILIMTTSFIRIVVVLSLLRTAIGLQQSAAERRDRIAVAVPHSFRHAAGLEYGVRKRHRSGDARRNARWTKRFRGSPSRSRNSWRSTRARTTFSSSSTWRAWKRRPRPPRMCRCGS